jgi:hypothetical protein
MVTNQDYQGNTDPTQELKIAAYEREIQQAQAAGIDGFALNVGGWLNQNYYIVYSAQMFEAAVRLNTGSSSCSPPTCAVAVHRGCEHGGTDRHRLHTGGRG